MIPFRVQSYEFAFEHTYMNFYLQGCKDNILILLRQLYQRYENHSCLPTRGDSEHILAEMFVV